MLAAKESPEDSRGFGSASAASVPEPRPSRIKPRFNGREVNDHVRQIFADQIFVVDADDTFVPLPFDSSDP